MKIIFRKYFCYIYLSLCSNSFLVIPTFSYGEFDRPSTDEVFKSKLPSQEIVTTKDRGSLSRCQKIKSVSTYRAIEFWQRKKACRLVMENLKKEVSFVKGDTLFVEIPLEGCVEGKLTGEAYKCK